MPEKIERGRMKTRVGRVVSNKMDKTVVVTMDRLIFHSRYKKRVKKTIRIYAHDTRNECGIGDLVRLIESRPLSKKKRWRVSNIMEKAK